MRSRRKKLFGINALVCMSMLSGCSLISSVKKFADNPLKATVDTIDETVQADEDFKKISADVQDLINNIRTLVETKGPDWVIDTAQVQVMLSQVGSLNERLLRLIGGGVGTAVAAAINIQKIKSDLNRVVAALQGASDDGITAGELALATNISISQPQQPQQPTPVTSPEEPTRVTQLEEPTSVSSPKAPASVTQLEEPTNVSSPETPANVTQLDESSSVESPQAPASETTLEQPTNVSSPEEPSAVTDPKEKTAESTQ